MFSPTTLLVLLILIQTFLTPTSTINVVAQEVDQSSTQQADIDTNSIKSVYTDEELRALSNEELEEICIVRGFQLDRDVAEDGTVIPLTREDYIEAATRCILIEQEINQILEERPELLEEFEKELEAVRKENERLIHEREEQMQRLDKLNNEMEEASSTTAGGAAFVPKQESSTASNPKESTDNNEDDEDTINNTKATTTVEELETDLSDPVRIESMQDDDDDDDDEVVVVEDLDVVDKDPNENTTTETTTPTTTRSDKEDLTFKAISMEILRGILKQAEDDVKRIIQIMLPVVQQIIHAGDKVWRHVRTLVVSLRNEYQQRNNDDDDSSNNEKTSKENDSSKQD